MNVQNLTALKGQQFDYYVQLDHVPNEINTTFEVIESNYTYTGNIYDSRGGTSLASFTITPSSTYLTISLPEATVTAMAQGDYWYNILQTPNDGGAPSYILAGRFFVIQP